MVFSEYANCYDLYYVNKDYPAEVDFVIKLASRFGNNPKTLLDMGCGSGRHLNEFIKQGLKCDGFDVSETMLEQARHRLRNKDVTLSNGNLTNFENGKQYDLVVSMFAVMGYLTDNDQLLSGMRTAHNHLKPKGIFVFDAWFGPAVLSQKPENRCHEYRDGQNTVLRKATPLLDPVRQTVTIHYEISIKQAGKVIKQIEEKHIMRFMFVREIALFMEMAGLELVYCCPFLEPDEELTIDTWNVSFLARRS